MLTSKDSDAHWECFGRIDPYFGVISDEEYKADRVDDEARQRFFASGRAHIDGVLDNVRTHFVAGFSPERALDFGCGVGRLVVPLAAVAGEVVGVDVSPSMIEEAKKNVRSQQIDNVRFVTGLDELSDDAKFDFIHSFIVFQHIPVRRGMEISNALLDRLRDGGIGVLHYTYHAPLYARVVHWVMRNIPFACNVYNLLLGRKLAYPIMQSNFYSVDRLLGTLQSHRCGKVYLEFTRHKRNSGVVLYFQRSD